MTNPLLPQATYINNADSFYNLIYRLADEPLLGIDTESNSLHAYRERVCLIQLSTRTADYIIDPLAISDIHSLGELLRDPHIEKVFHAAEYDLICLKRDYGFTVANLFDTMHAARVCGAKTIGLSSMLEKYFGVRANKKHQRDNWGKRPLPLESLRYAQMDTHYLPELRDILHAELVNCGRLEEALEIFAESCDVGEVEHNGFDPDGFWWLGLPNSLNRRQMAILRELYLMREDIACEQDVPTFKIFHNTTLLALAQAAPRRLSELNEVDGVKPIHVRRYGKRVLSAVDKGWNERLPSRPRREPPSPIITERFTILRDWRKGRARERGVEADVIISKHTLWALAHRMPATLDDLRGIRGLGPWRLQTYGPELLDVIASFKNGNGK